MMRTLCGALGNGVSMALACGCTSSGQVGSEKWQRMKGTGFAASPANFTLPQWHEPSSCMVHR